MGFHFTNTTHNILPKPLAAFTHNYRRNNSQLCERNSSSHNDYSQSSDTSRLGNRTKEVKGWQKRCMEICNIDVKSCGIKLFPKQALCSMCLQCKIWKTLRQNEKLLVESNFSFFHSVSPVGELSTIFNQMCNCHLQTLSVRKLLNFVVWESVKEVGGLRPWFGKYIPCLYFIIPRLMKHEHGSLLIIDRLYGV